MYYLSNNTLIPVLQTSDWQMFFTIACIKSFKVPNLSLFAARQTILPPLSLALIERPVLAIFLSSTVGNKLIINL